MVVNKVFISIYYTYTNRAKSITRRRWRYEMSRTVSSKVCQTCAFAARRRRALAVLLTH